MSDNIPFEIQIEIMNKLPVKPLIQFRSVSKQWKATINSSDFIADYTVRGHYSTQHHLFIRYQNLSDRHEYVSLVGDHTFPQNKFSPPVPSSVTLLGDSSQFVRTSHGLICLYNYHTDTGTPTVVVWNPIIRKSVAIAVSNAHRPDGIHFGFGVCPRTCDPKIVMIEFIDRHTKLKTLTGNNHERWRVEVFTLSSGVWRGSIGNLPGESVEFGYPEYYQYQVVVNGINYWLATTRVSTLTNLLVSFDLSTEEFGEILLPAELASHRSPGTMRLYNLYDSVVVQKYPVPDLMKAHEVWMMENKDDSKSFVKLYNFDTAYGIDGPGFGNPRGFRRNGEILMLIVLYKDESGRIAESSILVAYDPVTKHFNDLGVKVMHGYVARLFMIQYTESLIRLDQRDTSVDSADTEIHVEQEERFRDQESWRRKVCSYKSPEIMLNVKINKQFVANS